MSPQRARGNQPPPDNAETAVAVREEVNDVDNVKAFRRDLEMRQDAIAKAVLGTSLDPDRVIEVTIRAVAKNQTLSRCTRLSLIQATMDAIQLGFEPTGKYGGAYLVPFWNKDAPTGKVNGHGDPILGAYEATMIPSFTGLVDLSYRSGIVTLIEGDTDGVVYSKDHFEYVRGWPDTRLVHIRSFDEDRGDVIGAWCQIHVRGSDRPLIGFLSEADIEKRRKVSKSGADKATGEPIGIWRQWHDEQRAKTVLRHTIDLAPKAVLEKIRPAFAAEDAADARLGSGSTAPQLNAGDDARRRRLLAGAVGSELGNDDVGGPEADDVGGSLSDPDADVAPEGGAEAEAATPPGARDVTPQNADAREAGEAPEAAQCGQVSPYEGDESTCYLIAGHPGSHRSSEATW